MGTELTWGWALAMVMKKTEPVETALFMVTMLNKSLNSPDDIRTVLMSATGISKEEFGQKINSQDVNEIVVFQEDRLRYAV